MTWFEFMLLLIIGPPVVAFTVGTLLERITR